MGISSQQFRITTGCFNPNLIFSYKLCKPKYKSNPRSKSRHKISIFKLLCFLFLCYCNCELLSGFSSHKSHDKSSSKWPASSFPESKQICSISVHRNRILPALVPNYYLKTQCEVSGHSTKQILKEPNLKRSSELENCIFPVPVPNYYLKTQCEASGPSAKPIFKEPNMKPSLELENCNFWARYTYGNTKKGIKLCHWNIGGGYLNNKIDTIESLISDYNPKILGISEASFWSDQNLEDVQIHKYKLYFANTLHNPQW